MNILTIELEKLPKIEFNAIRRIGFINEYISESCLKNLSILSNYQFFLRLLKFK